MAAAPTRHRAAARPSAALRAAALGLLHGPAEVLPVSSSGHVALLAHLLGWASPVEGPAVEKTFAVALHGGTLAGLALGLAPELQALRETVRRAPAASAAEAVHALALAAPAGLAGLVAEDLVERRLGGVRQVARAQVLAGAALAAADLFGEAGAARHGGADQEATDVTGRRHRRLPVRRAARDARRAGPAVALAQVLALAPGVSRSGAALTAARALGVSRRAAQAWSLRAGLPVVLGATAHRLLPLMSTRATRSAGPAPGGGPAASAAVAPGTDGRAALAAGALGAVAGGLAAAPLARRTARGSALWPLGLYRIALGALVLHRSRAATTADRVGASPDPHET